MEEISEDLAQLMEQWEAKLFAEHVTLATLDCGHCLALERPEQLADLLRRFMS